MFPVTESVESEGIVPLQTHGTDITGLNPLGSASVGIAIAASDTMVGGTEPGAGNLIAFNGVYSHRAGVEVTSIGNPTRISILGNSFHSKCDGVSCCWALTVSNSCSNCWTSSSNSAFRSAHCFTFFSSASG